MISHTKKAELKNSKHNTYTSKIRHKKNILLHYYFKYLFLKNSHYRYNI